MNKLRPVALLCTGRVSRSPLVRLPFLGRHTVWVKSSSYRVASRAASALGGGIPVVHWNEMTRAGIWVVSVPRDELERTLGELHSAGLDWRGRVLLILDAEAESDLAAPFRVAGGAVASFTPIENDETRYLVEGDTDAVKVVRLLVGDVRRKAVVRIKKGAKARYLAGARAATKEVLPLIADAVEHFQSAGLSNSDARSLTEALLSGAMRSYFRAGRRALK